MKFGTVLDEEGDEVELTHGRYSGFMESADRRVRKDAFTKLYGAFEKQKNTLAATYNYNTKTDIVLSRIRKYDSPMQAALESDLIPVNVYDNLVATVNEKLPLLHRYIEVRRSSGSHKIQKLRRRT
jgi:oligoendopeptidase F